MAVAVEIRLLSGRTAAVKASVDEEVGTLRLQAQRALGVGKGRLMDSSGAVLDVSAAIKDSGVRNGDSLTLHINRAQASATAGAFAAVIGDGSVVAWGDAHHGGNISVAQSKLKNVRQIQASSTAFAAILGDGSVITWGDAGSGGDSSAVQAQLKNVSANPSHSLGLCCHS